MDRAELNHALSNKRTDKKGGFLKSRSKHLVVSSFPSQYFLFPSLPSLSFGVAYFG
jgi:hypothetical protein